MLADNEAMDAIENKVGDYDWFIADELIDAVNYLENNKSILELTEYLSKVAK